MKKLREFIVRWKFRVSYFSGFLTAFAAVIILSNTLQEKLTLLHIGVNYLIVLLVVVALSILGAFLLDRLGFIESEIHYSNTKNIMLKEIREGTKNGSNDKDR